MSEQLLTPQNSIAFDHFAMNTTFAIRYPKEALGNYDLEAISGACFVELDRIEDLLSRYQEESEVSQINRLKTGESLILHEDTYEVLKKGFELYVLTNGLFNITIGAHTWAEEHEDYSDEFYSDDSGSFSLDPERPIIYCLKEGRQIDLGGVGKGYALDKMKQVLEDQIIPEALLCAGNSTYLGIGERPWEIQLQTDSSNRTIELKNEALSASGTAIQGAHIINPSDANNRDYHHENVWVITEEATNGDALSTTCMLASIDEMKEIQEDHNCFHAVFVEKDNSIIQVLT